MKIGAVLPLSIDGTYGSRDLVRADMLFASLGRYSEPNLFEKILVVTPEDEVLRVRESLSKWERLPIIVLSEIALLPELTRYPKVRGWKVQQLVKLAAANIFESEFYLTFDADVVCTRKITYDTLIPEGKAILQYEPRDGHFKWWRSSSLILQVPFSKKDTQWGMSVTPAVLASRICRSLMEQIKISGSGSWVDELCGLHNSAHPQNWSIKRYLMRRWTEYTLYYLFAEKVGLLDQYHVTVGSVGSLDQISTRAPEPPQNWDVSNTFSGPLKSAFCVVNSKGYPDPEAVLDRLKSYIFSSDQLNQAMVEESSA